MKIPSAPTWRAVFTAGAAWNLLTNGWHHWTTGVCLFGLLALQVGVVIQRRRPT